MKIVVDILPAMGHFNPLVKLVHMLQSAGHEIIFIDQGLKAEIARFGFQSFSTGFELSPVLLNRGEITFRKFFRYLFSKTDEKLIIELENRFQKFKECLEEISPDIVLLDEQNMLKAVFYEICTIPVISIETKPEPCRNRNVPPFTSTYIPSDTSISKWVCSLLWLNKILKNKFRLKMIRYRSGGVDNYTLTRRIASSYGIDWRKRLCLNRGCGIGIKNIPRLNISAAAFDFPKNNSKNTFYVGPLTDINRDNQSNTPRYDVLFKNLVNFKKKANGSVIYCSLGSYSVMHMKRLRCFFLKMAEVARKQPDDVFILSTGEYFDVGDLYPVPDNMYVFDYLPQVNLLGICDIMITHGGMNSITECVLYEIPILVYPVSPDWDQPGNGARTIYHKIGLMGSISKDSVKGIRKKLDHIKTNYYFYRTNIHKLKKKFEKKNNSLEAVEIIEDLIRQNQKKYDICKHP